MLRVQLAVLSSEIEARLQCQRSVRLRRGKPLGHTKLKGRASAQIGRGSLEAGVPRYRAHVTTLRSQLTRGVGFCGHFHASFFFIMARKIKRGKRSSQPTRTFPAGESCEVLPAEYRSDVFLLKRGFNFVGLGFPRELGLACTGPVRILNAGLKRNKMRSPSFPH